MIFSCDKILKPKGINIVEIITSNDEKIFDNILNAFVGITAIQIGLTDVLNAVGLVPDKIIGKTQTKKLSTDSLTMKASVV